MSICTNVAIHSRTITIMVGHYISLQSACYSNQMHTGYFVQLLHNNLLHSVGEGDNFLVTSYVVVCHTEGFHSTGRPSDILLH